MCARFERNGKGVFLDANRDEVPMPELARKLFERPRGIGSTTQRIRRRVHLIDLELLVDASADKLHEVGARGLSRRRDNWVELSVRADANLVEDGRCAVSVRARDTADKQDREALPHLPIIAKLERRGSLISVEGYAGHLGALLLGPLHDRRGLLLGLRHCLLLKLRLHAAHGSGRAYAVARVSRLETGETRPGRPRGFQRRLARSGA